MTRLAWTTINNMDHDQNQEDPWLQKEQLELHTQQKQHLQQQLEQNPLLEPQPQEHSSNQGVIVDWSVDDRDVLCGRHQRSVMHPGNKRFRAIVQKYCEQYQSTPRRLEKASITNEVISIVHNQQGGRFLKEVEEFAPPSFWVPLTHAEIHEKVSHALRSTKVKSRMSFMSSTSSAGSNHESVADAASSADLDDQEEERAFTILSQTQKQIFDALLKNSSDQN